MAVAPSEAAIAGQLSSGHGIDAETLKRTLITHLSGRLDELEASIGRTQRTLFGGLPDLAPSALWSDGIVHLAQLHEAGPPDSLDALFNANVPYDFADLAGWRRAVSDMEGVEGKLELFSAVADVEDHFEALERQMDDLVERIGLEFQREEEIRRGK